MSEGQGAILKPPVSAFWTRQIIAYHFAMSSYQLFLMQKLKLGLYNKFNSLKTLATNSNTVKKKKKFVKSNALSQLIHNNFSWPLRLWQS